MSLIQDMPAIAAGKEVNADTDKGQVLFNTVCANCHGYDGQKIKKHRAIGKVAVVNPQMTLHMIVNGHPAKEMPALRALDPNIISEILAYIQTLPTER